MSHVVSSAHPAFTEMFNALGLKNLTKVVITFEANKAVVVEASTLLVEDGANAMSEVFKRFKLTEDVCK